MNKRIAVVVSHSHWDRAWYLPFEVFRHRLVRLIDRVTELLDTDVDFASFMLDGQAVLLEDYLEIRPERADDLVRLISAGRLTVGPWYTAPDLFLPSPEALIRNLQRGLGVSKRFGGGERIGYVPDPFGHPAQMPQIMHGFGIDLYIFMRGMPDEQRNKGGMFLWTSPDGTQIRAHYLRDGYFGAGGLGLDGVFGRFDGLEPDPHRAVEQIRDSLSRSEELQDVPVFLLLNGFDHMPVQAQLPDLLNAIQRDLPDVELRHGRLADFRAELQATDSSLPVFEGDLLGQADHPILSSVWSTRMYLKQQNHAAEDALIRHAEPIAACLGAADTGPFLSHAWKLLLLNHPHDDICGCSVDAVHEDDEARFRQVTELADALITEQLETMLRSNGDDAWRTDDDQALLFVFNPHPFPIISRIDAEVHFPIPGGETGEPRPRAPLSALGPDGSPVSLVLRSFSERVMRAAYLEQTWAEKYEISCELTLPPLGYSIIRVRREDLLTNGPEQPGEGTQGLSIAGGSIRLKDIPHEIPSLLHFEYERDAGDTYSFSPVRGDLARRSRIVGHQTAPDGGLEVRFEIDVPESLDTDHEITIPILVRLRRESSGGISARIRYRNTARNGRLRAIISSGLDADRIVADGQFLLNEHGRVDVPTPESDPHTWNAYPGEFPYATRHQRSFVYLRDDHLAVWIANRGMPEYELRPSTSAAEVAVTLHRAVGYLSVVGGRQRRCGAGPNIPVPGAQCLREVDTTLTIGTCPDDIRAVSAAALPAAHPPYVREMPYLPYRNGIRAADARASWLSIDDPAIRLASYRRIAPDLCALRLVNPTGDERGIQLRIDRAFKSLRRTSLEEDWASGVDVPREDGSITFAMNPGEIVTLLVQE